MQFVVLSHVQLLCSVLILPVKIEVTMSSRAVLTKLTLEWFHLLMNSPLVMLQLGGNEKHFITFITDECLVSDMNHPNMYL